MVLKMLSSAVSLFPSQYLVHCIVAVIVTLALRAISQGRSTTRERDLHARVILVTGGFSALGITILQNLAERGAHIIALTPEPVESPRVSILIDLLRSTTSNEQIYAEHCDLSSPASIHSFCERFLSGEDKRLDALLFTHEYGHIGALKAVRTTDPLWDEKERDVKSLATFLLTTLLLPSLLVAPVERDIRIINVVNRFYAAATARPSFSVAFSSLSSTPSSNIGDSTIFLAEGMRSLRTVLFTRHLQRVLDALPSAQVPKAEAHANTVPVVDAKVQKSNIIAVSVSPGISRVDTVASLLNADWTQPHPTSRLGVFLYVLLQPFLRILTKAPVAAVQSILHVLFLPTPFKVRFVASSPMSGDVKEKSSSGLFSYPEEILKPGALYAECAVVNLKVPSPEAPKLANISEKGGSKGKGEEKMSEKELMELPDDGEFGGEPVGRIVWEAYENALKAWEKALPSGEEGPKVPKGTGKSSQ